ncbi:MAG TPA: T9SS type A sorting domain-containing protein [Bacteroidetes bacterium]|nr:T9SS type A sorting domain-containing protein [Bacteroidota bacterium]
MEGISGYTFEDSNQDCIFNSSDVGLKNIPLKVFASGNQIGSVITARNGVYQFPIGAGNYRVELDVATAPIAFSCPNPGLDSNVVVATAAPFVENVNFEVTCPSGFDVGAQAAFPVGPVFPGQSHVLHVSAGDRSNFYGLHCAAGTVGQVVIEVTGPVTYTGPGAGALSPSISGITYTYGPVDFDTINFSTDFALGFFTDTTAQSGDTICVNVTVTPTLGDNDASNNSLALCYQVSNSLDPNDKIVYPTQVTTGYTGWLYYTLRFQNTGTAPAYNIRLADTLANELDWSTFQLLEMSHTATVSLVQGNLNFKFDGILLPDSLSDPLGSQGFVQFRMRPKSTVPDGWEVKNTASIYFDFNPPVVTNTAKTLFGDMVAVADPFIQGWLKVFPNPGKGQFQVTWEGPKSAGPITLTVYNAMGQLVSTKQSFREVASFDLQQQAAGIYFVRASSKAGNQVVRLIKR